MIVCENSQFAIYKRSGEKLKIVNKEIRDELESILKIINRHMYMYTYIKKVIICDINIHTRNSVTVSAFVLSSCNMCCL